LDLLELLDQLTPKISSTLRTMKLTMGCGVYTMPWVSASFGE